MADQKPKWPESLPPPSEVTEGPRRVHLVPGDLVREGAIQTLVHDLYWFPKDEYFLFFVYRGIGDVGIGDVVDKLKYVIGDPP
jgi:hypothetical protein